MYRQIQDFLADWQEETKSTIRLFETLTEESLEKKVYKQGRDLGRIAWHIVQTVSEMGHTAGLLPTDKLAQEEIPPFIPALIAIYRGQTKRFEEALQQQWADASLPEAIQMYGEQWARGRVLQILIKHQAHHRGQMTVLMRQAGLKVPGMYGPSKEEWKEYGMAAVA